MRRIRHSYFYASCILTTATELKSCSSTTAKVCRELVEANTEKFQGIISRDLHDLEEHLIKQLKSVDTAPPPLFEKTSNKFDPLTGVGVSSALQACVLVFIVSAAAAVLFLFRALF